MECLMVCLFVCCVGRYIQCMHQMLYHLTASDYEEFASVVVSARTALHLTPEGTAQFKDWLQCIRRYSCSHYNGV